MKSQFLVFIFALLLIISCEKEIIPDTFNFGIEENFQFGDNYQSNNKTLQFSITEINDSRCPSDVVCVWEGKIDVKIEVESPQKGTIVLSTFDNKIDSVGNFSFEIKEVSPYPVSTETIKLEDYDITLKILEL